MLFGQMAEKWFANFKSDRTNTDWPNDSVAQNNWWHRKTRVKARQSIATITWPNWYVCRKLDPYELKKGFFHQDNATCNRSKKKMVKKTRITPQICFHAHRFCQIWHPGTFTCQERNLVRMKNYFTSKDRLRCIEMWEKPTFLRK